MDNLLPVLQQTMTNEQINQAMESLGRQLRATTDPSAPPGFAGPVWPGGFDVSSARALLSTALPPLPAAQILGTLNTLAASGVVNVAPPPTLTSMATRARPVKDKPKPPLTFPWALLSDPVAISVLGPEVLSSLGLDSSLSPDEMLVDLAMKWPQAPIAEIQANRAVAEGIHAAIQKIPGGGGGGSGGGGGGGGGVLNPIQEIETVIEAFARATYESYWWGYMIGLDAAGGQAISSILSGASAPVVLKGLAAAIAAKGGIVAALGAGATAIGPWIVVALVLYGLYLAMEIALNVDAQGVWICGIWMLMIPLWAQGR